MVVEHLLSDRNVSVIGIWDLDIIWDLGFEIWNFRLVFREANYFYLSQLLSIMILPCSIRTMLDTGNAGA